MNSRRNAIPQIRSAACAAAAYSHNLLLCCISSFWILRCCNRRGWHGNHPLLYVLPPVAAHHVLPPAVAARCYRLPSSKIPRPSCCIGPLEGATAPHPRSPNWRQLPLSFLSHPTLERLPCRLGVDGAPLGDEDDGLPVDPECHSLGHEAIPGMKGRAGWGWEVGVGGGAGVGVRSGCGWGGVWCAVVPNDPGRRHLGHEAVPAMYPIEPCPTPNTQRPWIAPPPPPRHSPPTLSATATQRARSACPPPAPRIGWQSGARQSTGPAGGGLPPLTASSHPQVGWPVGACSVQGCGWWEGTDCIALKP